MPGQMHDVPALWIGQRRLQRLSRGAVLQDLGLDPTTAGDLGELAQQAGQRPPLPDQRERRQPFRQREDGQHPQRAIVVGRVADPFVWLPSRRPAAVPDVTAASALSPATWCAITTRSSTSDRPATRASSSGRADSRVAAGGSRRTTVAGARSASAPATSPSTSVAT